jgi:Ca-activated chloride channel family protein
MTFLDPRWLWGLVALPLLLLTEWRSGRRVERALAALVGRREEHALLAQRRPGDRRLGALLRLGAIALLLVGAAGPEWGREVVRRAATGSDIVMLIDVSASMDARDVAPSRLAEARREALAVVDRLAGSRVGVVAFAGDAVRLCPLTLDRGAVRLTLESLSSATVSEPGTDLGRGLRAALKLMPGGRREEQAIVAWTDGEDLEEGARPALEEVARSAIRVFAVGVGSAAGDVVPVLDDQGRAVDVKRDERGNVVRSRLDEGLLRLVARRTRGGYFAAQRPGGELPRLLAAVGSLARAGRGTRLVERPVARFPWFAGAAALLIATDLARPRRRAPRRSRAPAAAKAAAVAAAALLSLALPAGARAQSAWARGDRAFRAGRFVDAESLYARRLARGGPDAVRVNQATARARAGNFAEAERDLARLGGREGPAGREARYNLGTLLGLEDREAEALEALRRALERDPTDEDARWNYEVLLRRRQERENPSPRGGGGSPPPTSPAEPRSGDRGTPRPRAGTSPAPQTGPSSPPSSGTQPRGAPQSMDRSQADRLLNALQDLARQEQQRQRKVRILRDRGGKDW